MRMKRIVRSITVLSIGLGILYFASVSLAAAFQLKKIGKLDTHGITFAKWWYSGNKPTFSGIGVAGQEVQIKIDETAATTTVGSNGDWSFTPAAPLATGDHRVSFTSSGSTIEFTLVITKEIPADVVAPSPPATPIAGGMLPTVFVSSLGSSLLAVSLLLKRN